MKTFYKYSIRFIFVCLMISMLLPNVLMASNAEDTLNYEEKVYSKATINDNYADNRILVVLSNETSLKFTDYERNDFEEISCLSVTDLTASSYEYMKMVMSQTINDTTSVLNENITIRGEHANLLKNFKRVLCIELEKSGKDKVLEAIRILEKREDVLYVGPDYMMTIQSYATNDTYLADNQWAIEKMQIDDAWGVTTGSSTVTVGVLDTGIDGSHPELINRVNTSLSRDFTNGSTTQISVPTDPNGHGTLVAGIIGAQANNNIGVAGVCWDVDLISLRVFDEFGIGYSSNLALAIDYATLHNIDILNLSGGWQHDYMIEDYYDYALISVIDSYPGLFICAAGNGGYNNDETPNYPSNYDLPNLLSVAASDMADQRYSGSNYGANTVDLFASGSGILSCYPKQFCNTECLNTNSAHSITHVYNGYHKSYGTSMATPYVSGVAALILSVNPNLTPYELKHIVMSNVDMNENLRNKCKSKGRLNAFNALNDVEDHAYIYESVGLRAGHVCICTECNKVLHEEPHIWTSFSSYYKCSRCFLTSTFIPIPYDELLTNALDKNDSSNEYSAPVEQLDS